LGVASWVPIVGGTNEQKNNARENYFPISNVLGWKAARLLDPLSRSSIMEEPVMPKSAPFQSDPTSASAADAAIYVQTNLVSDIPGLATAFDPHLVKGRFV
jgi:hypothetical protein